MQKENLQSIVEAMVFVADRPVSFKQLQDTIGDVSAAELKETLENIKKQYQLGHHGIYLESVGGGFQFRTKLDKSPWLQKLTEARPTKLTRSQLEALAIIAYRQPVTRVDLDAVRGVDSTHQLKMLLDKKLIRILGVKEAVGRPLIYGTTPEFLEFFNLYGLDALPRLEDLRELQQTPTKDLPLFAKDSLDQSDIEFEKDHSSNESKSSGS